MIEPALSTSRTCTRRLGIELVETHLVRVAVDVLDRMHGLQDQPRLLERVAASSAVSIMALSCCELRAFTLGTSDSGERTALAPNSPAMKMRESMPMAIASAR